MAVMVKYHTFLQELGRGGHDLNADALKMALTDTAPDVATHATLADIGEIAAGGGYSAGGAAVTNTAYSQSGGVATLTGDDAVFSASGSVAAFRYAVLYNSSKSDKLIGYADRGSSAGMTAGDSFTVDADPVSGYLQVA